MALTITINGTVTLDESAGLQNATATPTPAGDADDNDVLLSTLQSGASAFYGRLFNATGSGGLGLSTSFATANGVAQSASNFITVSGTGITSLGFVDGNGAGLSTYTPGVTNPTSGVLLTNVDAVNGGNVYLFKDASLGDRMALGVDTDGDVVFALFLDPNAALTSARVWMVQFESIFNPVTVDPDDAVNLSDNLGVAATQSLEFKFDTLPSGQNLFGVVGDTSTALVVIGKTPVLNANGTFTNTSNTINTSQGGGGVTIGVNNQMFDLGEGAYFTLVKNPNPSFLSGVTGGLDQNEADDADNILFGDTLEVSSTFTRISQIQGNSLATMRITAINMDPEVTGPDFALNGDNDGIGKGTPSVITSVKVFNAAGTLIEDSSGAPNSPTVGISIDNGVATVSGLNAGYKVEWTTSGVHDQVLIECVGGKFDIGAFGANEVGTQSTDIGQFVKFEDDGPARTLGEGASAGVTVDETTDLGQPFTFQGADVFAVDSSNSGTDGAGTVTTVYDLILTEGADSGVDDTLSGDHILLRPASSPPAGVDKVEGYLANAASTVAFTIALNTATGVITLTQSRAVIHDDPDDPDEPGASAASLLTNVISLKRTDTITDSEGDFSSTNLTAPIGGLFAFEDDGPSITGNATAVPVLATDDTDITDSAGPTSFVSLFTSIFGNDGSKDADDNDIEDADAIKFELGVSAANGVDSTLQDSITDRKIFLFLQGGVVNGRLGTAVGVADAAGTIAFTISVNGNTGDVSLTQNRAIEHNDPNDSVETGTSAAGFAASLVTLKATITDGDGDSASATRDIGDAFRFEDDGPAIGLVSDSIVDFAAGSSATKSLLGDVGSDAKTSPYTVTAFTSSLVVNGTTLQGVASGGDTVVSYYADTNGNSTFGDVGDTKFYELSLNQTANSGAGSYTFDVLVNPPPALLEFKFDTLPSGQNLFGVVGDTSTALVVIGKTPVLNANGTFTNTSNTINTSQGGGGVTIGVNNQMFDLGEGAYFTLVKNPNPSFLSGVTGGLDQNEADDADNILFGDTLEVSSTFTRISQIQGNSLATMRITAINMDPEVTGPDFALNGDNDGIGKGTPSVITSVKVFNAAGTLIEDSSGAPNSPTVGISIDNGVATVSGLNAGYKVEWTTSGVHDQVLIECAGGKFDIGSFGSTQAQPTPDQLLEFTVQAIDADSDTAQDDFSVGIDGTGIYDDGVVAGVVPLGSSALAWDPA
jgi:hypothetical protein